MNKQQGSAHKQGSAHIVIATVLALALVTALGWIFYQNFIHKEAPVKDTELVVVDKTKPSSEEEKQDKKSASWLMYESQNKKYSVAIPDGWSLTSQRSDDDIIAWTSDKIKYTEGTKAKVETIDGGRGGSSTAFYLLYDYKVNEGAYISPELKKVSSFTTSQNIKVEKSTRTQQSRSAEMDIPYGTKQYAYDFYKGSVRVHIVHDVLEGETDQSSTIEDMIDTFKFL